MPIFEIIIAIIAGIIFLVAFVLYIGLHIKFRKKAKQLAVDIGGKYSIFSLFPFPFLPRFHVVRASYNGHKLFVYQMFTPMPIVVINVDDVNLYNKWVPLIEISTLDLKSLVDKIINEGHERS